MTSYRNKRGNRVFVALTEGGAAIYEHTKAGRDRRISAVLYALQLATVEMDNRADDYGWEKWEEGVKRDGLES